MALANKARSVDVVLVGAGLVGSIGALLLAQAGYQVQLVERGGPPAQPGGEPRKLAPGQTPDIARLPLRHVALSPASQACLSKINAWPIPNLGLFSSMQVWEERGTARLSVDAAQVQREELGWVAQHDWLLWHLHQQFAGLDRILVDYHREVDGLEQTEDGVRVSMASTAADPSDNEARQPAVVDAVLVIGADGANSAIAKRCRVPIARQETGHHAQVAMVRFAQPHQAVARQRFLLDGPLALLPSAWPDLVSIVWSQSEGQAARRAQLSAAEFCAELSTASDNALGTALEVGPRAGFPIAQQLADRFLAAPGVLLLGDAAHVIHPLAGQGVNAGLEDMTELLTLLGRRRDHFRLPAGLARFAAKRRARAQTMALVMGGLQGIYAQGNPALNLLRNTGVRLLQGSGLGQRLLIEQALGLRGQP